MTNPSSSVERHFSNLLLTPESRLTLTSIDAKRPAEILKKKLGERSIEIL